MSGFTSGYTSGYNLFVLVLIWDHHNTNMDNINKIINKSTTKQIIKSLSNQSDENQRANLIALILMGYRPPVNQGIDSK